MLGCMSELGCMMSLHRESRVDVLVPLNNQNTVPSNLHDTSLTCTLLPPTDQEDGEAVVSEVWGLFRLPACISFVSL